MFDFQHLQYYYCILLKRASMCLPPSSAVLSWWIDIILFLNQDFWYFWCFWYFCSCVLVQHVTFTLRVHCDPGWRTCRNVWQRIEPCCRCEIALSKLSINMSWCLHRLNRSTYMSTYMPTYVEHIQLWQMHWSPEHIQLWQMQIALNNMLSNDLELCDWALKNEVACSWNLLDMCGGREPATPLPLNILEQWINWFNLLERVVTVVGRCKESWDLQWLASCLEAEPPPPDIWAVTMSYCLAWKNMEW